MQDGDLPWWLNPDRTPLGNCLQIHGQVMVPLTADPERSAVNLQYGIFKMGRGVWGNYLALWDPESGEPVDQQVAFGGMHGEHVHIALQHLLVAQGSEDSRHVNPQAESENAMADNRALLIGVLTIVGDGDVQLTAGVLRRQGDRELLRTLSAAVEWPEVVAARAERGVEPLTAIQIVDAGTRAGTATEAAATPPARELPWDKLDPTISN